MDVPVKRCDIVANAVLEFMTVFWDVFWIMDADFLTFVICITL